MCRLPYSAQLWANVAAEIMGTIGCNQSVVDNKPSEQVKAVTLGRTI